MAHRSLTEIVATAALVVVILPLLVAVAAVCVSFGIEAAAGPRFGLFGPMGTSHLLMLAWAIVAVIVISTLVALLMNDRWHHA